MSTAPALPRPWMIPRRLPSRRLCRGALAVLLGCALFGGPARGEPSAVVTTVKGELGGYTDSDSVTVFTPAVSAAVRDDTRGWTARGNYLADIISAASVDIVSTASRHWNEVRHAGGVGATYKPRDVGIGADVTLSSEPDYLSLGAGGRLLLELEDKTVNPVFAYSYSHDRAGRTGTLFSVYSQDLARHTLTAGVELVLDGATVVSFAADAAVERGDQKKPYRLLPLFAPDVASGIPAGASLALVNATRLPGRASERTPLDRNRFALTARFARRFSGSTLLLSDRLYADDWGLFATTTDARYVLDVGRRFLGWLHFRGHLQSGVSFWERAYTAQLGDESATLPAYRTGDRELSPLTAWTFGAGVRANLGTSARPTAWGVILQEDSTVTYFRDALYVRDRIGHLLVLQLEAEL